MQVTTENVLKKAQEMSETGKIKTAADLYRGVLESEQDPGLRIHALYTLAVVNWMLSGNGTEASAGFEKVLETLGSEPRFRNMPNANIYEMNSIENLMLMSLSFDKYEEWAGRLKAINPGADILKGQYPRVMELKDAGHPWSDILISIAQTYYNRSDPNLDRGMYGAALSVYELILSNRRLLRLQRDDYRFVLYEHFALMYKHLSDNVNKLRNHSASVDPEDYRFMLDRTYAFYEEYLKACPADEPLEAAYKGLKEFDAELAAIARNGFNTGGPTGGCGGGMAEDYSVENQTGSYGGYHAEDSGGNRAGYYGRNQAGSYGGKRTGDAPMPGLLKPVLVAVLLFAAVIASILKLLKVF